MASDDEELIYEAIATRVETFSWPDPFDIHWHGGGYVPVYGRSFVELGQAQVDQNQEAGSPVHSRIARYLIMKIAVPEPQGELGWIKFAEAMREHFFPNGEIRDLQSGAGPFVRIEQRPELLKSSSGSDEITETVFGFIRGRLGIKFFFEPTV